MMAMMAMIMTMMMMMTMMMTMVMVNVSMVTFRVGMMLNGGGTVPPSFK